MTRRGCSSNLFFLALGAWRSGGTRCAVVLYSGLGHSHDMVCNSISFFFIGITGLTHRKLGWQEEGKPCRCPKLLFQKEGRLRTRL
jgi:hypothetical protein